MVGAAQAGGRARGAVSVPNRWLVTGSAGMLGHDLVAALGDQPVVTVDARTRDTLDLADATAVRAAVEGASVVVNCAAWTDVDGAETAEDEARAVNGDAVATLASACSASGARLLHVSTDYVFPGVADEPYGEDATTGPVNAYGRTKLLGERAVLSLHPADGYVVRTAWLYGRNGRNFVSTMTRLAQEIDTVDVVDDQVGQPTWARELARRLVALGGSTAPPGVYHVSGGGQTTWCGLAKATFAMLGHDPERVRPATSTRFPRPAQRPAYGVLGSARWTAAGLEPMAPWQDGLRRYLESDFVYVPRHVS